VITKKDNYVEFAVLVMGLDEACEHLQELTKEMASSEEFSEVDFEVRLGHIYAHLNRAWNGRNHTGEVTFEQHVAYNQFPRDIEPVG
jgi:hypothetical protein